MYLLARTQHHTLEADDCAVLVPYKTYLAQLVVQHHQLLASGPLRVVCAAHRLCSQQCTAVVKQRKQAYARLLAEQVMSQRTKAGSCSHPNNADISSCAAWRLEVYGVRAAAEAMRT